MSNQNIRTREKITSLITVLLIWGICTLVCLHFYLGSQTKNFTSHKELIIKKSERQEKLHSDQLAYNKLCDSLNARIGRFDPSVNASFEESDIKFMISDLKDMYEKNAWDFRYKVFYHTAQFYDMWFAEIGRAHV